MRLELINPVETVKLKIAICIRDSLHLVKNIET